VKASFMLFRRREAIPGVLLSDAVGDWWRDDGAGDSGSLCAGGMGGLCAGGRVRRFGKAKSPPITTSELTCFF
jgi:hypothetical protein